MKKETKQKLIYKKESERTPSEKLLRDIICYLLVIYVSTLAFFWVNSQIKLADAQTELVNASLMSAQVMMQ
ncbi:hypothetical protein II582_00740 [bacterium]|nr:hypothetical protein [bacterium]